MYVYGYTPVLFPRAESYHYTHLVSCHSTLSLLLFDGFSFALCSKRSERHVRIYQNIVQCTSSPSTKPLYLIFNIFFSFNYLKSTL